MSNLIQFDILVSIIEASIVALLIWFILGVGNNNNKKKEHDEKLFKQPPPNDDCPICFLRLPSLNTGWRYYVCCGKVICSGCIHAPVYDDQGNEVDNQKCPFCRTPKSNKERARRIKKRVDAGDANAMHILGYDYRDGRYGYPQDYTKALELFHRAADLGCAHANSGIGYAYSNGKGVERDEKKANYYYELAAMGGDVCARYNLGVREQYKGNMDRALKHLMIAVRSGDSVSLKIIKQLYSNGNATKDECTKALQLYQECLGEIKSDQRDEAAATDEDDRYY